MKRKAQILILAALVALLMLLFPALVFAQIPTGCVSVYGSGMNGSSGMVPAQGTITFSPVNASGSSISYLGACGGISGQLSSAPITAAIINGAFSVALPDVTLTNPPSICFSVVATETGTGANLITPGGYKCLNPHGSPTGSGDWCQSIGCNFNAYAPTFTAPSQAYNPPDLLTMWNNLVSTNGPVSKSTAVDASTVTLNTAGASMSAFTLPLYAVGPPAASDGITARTINVTGLTASTYFTIIINPLHSMTAPTAQSVTFGTGCNWQFTSNQNVVLSGNTLTIPAWATGTYMGFFYYDGTNCVGVVGN
jgi:hypothetical protein